MSSKSAETSSNNVCVRCSEEISGKALKAKEMLFHEEGNCFSCESCKISLKDASVYAKEGKIFCEQHYKEKYVPKCCRCLEYITDACLKAMDKTWHKKCFTCWTCKVQFDEKTQYHEHNNHPFCEACYIEEAVPKCAGCSKPILDKSVKALDQVWHLTCFVCTKCRKTFEGDTNFYSVENKPVCITCAGVEK